MKTPLLSLFLVTLAGQAFADEVVKDAEAEGRYQMIVSSADKGVWQVDSATGAVRMCAFVAGLPPQPPIVLYCSRPTPWPEK